MISLREVFRQCQSAIAALLDVEGRNKALVTEVATTLLGPPCGHMDTESIARGDRLHGWQFIDSFTDDVEFMILTVAVDCGEPQADLVNDLMTQDIVALLRSRGVSCSVKNPILGSIYPVRMKNTFVHLASARRLVTVR